MPRVLTIDDDARVVRAYTRVLRGRAQVEVATGGQEALDIIAEGRSYDLILCDLQMPGMNGVRFHQALGARHAALLERVIFCSGGAATPEIRAFLEQVPHRIIYKPIRPAELRELVASEALAASTR